MVCSELREPVGQLAGLDARPAVAELEDGHAPAPMDPSKVQLLKDKLAKAKASVNELSVGTGSVSREPVDTLTKSKKARKQESSQAPVRIHGGATHKVLQCLQHHCLVNLHGSIDIDYASAIDIG